MSFSAPTMEQDLRAHGALCEELLALAAAEREQSRAPDFAPGRHDGRRKDLLPQLEQSLHRLRTHRSAWQGLSAPERARHPEIPRLIRTTQEVAMKVIVLDRENEQALLRRGLVPSRHLPPARQEPHYVAGLYQRHRT